jgi:hypothetical protein
MDPQQRLLLEVVYEALENGMAIAPSPVLAFSFSISTAASSTMLNLYVEYLTSLYHCLHLSHSVILRLHFVSGSGHCDPTKQMYRFYP